MQTVAVARYAMATRFEIVLHGENAPNLRAAAEEALDEVDHLEDQLSLYRPGSEIARINASASTYPVRVSPPTFRLLQHARRLHDEAEGMFDITIAPLARCYGFMHGGGRLPLEEELSAARACVGMHHVILHEENYSVGFDREGVMLDLGAIGKGYAIERAAMVLREAGVTSALIHGGTSTVYAIGKPLDGEAWKVAIECPPVGASQGMKGSPHPLPSDGRGDQRWAVSSEEHANGGVRRWPPARAIVTLDDEALSVSAVWGKSFEVEGQQFGHVLDPRSGRPVCNAVLAAVAVASATESDALSTALLVAGPGGHERIAQLRSPMRTLVIAPGETKWEVATRGITTI